MKKQVIIIFIGVFLVVGYAFSQPINYLYNNNEVSKNYIIQGKSKLKIANRKDILRSIKENTSFMKFCSNYKDSLDVEIISSLIIFKVDNYIITNTNLGVNDFEFNNIANKIVDTISEKMKLKNLMKEKYLLGFYIHYIPRLNKFIYEFVEFKDDKYYIIYKGKG